VYLSNSTEWAVPAFVGQGKRKVKGSSREGRENARALPGRVLQQKLIRSTSKETRCQTWWMLPAGVVIYRTGFRCQVWATGRFEWDNFDIDINIFCNSNPDSVPVRE
jgi:hypothetical protein